MLFDHLSSAPVFVADHIGAVSVAAGVTLLAVTMLAFARPRAALHPMPDLPVLSPFATVVFDGTRIGSANDAAMALSLMPQMDVVECVAVFDLEEPEPLFSALQRLVTDGVAFSVESASRAGHVMRFDGNLSGLRAVLSVRDVTARVRREEALARRIADDSRASRALSEAVEAVPVLAWRMDEKGTQTWTNTAERADRLSLIADLQTALKEKAITPGDPPTRITLTQHPSHEPTWYEVTAHPDRGDGALFVARSMNDVMRAEQALSRFLETLTETFAHLPIGLAIFDADRTLGLFNPALSDHIGLEPAWLAGRPTLRAFLDQLRERRIIPEQTDFKGWREQFTSMERAAEEERYCEIWHLPNGQALRVTGRPHPQGALAFLFEDITTAIGLEQKYSGALAMRETALERMPAQIAIFDASGMQVMSTFAEDADAPPMGVHTSAKVWATRFGSAPAWDRMVRFATDGVADRAPRHDNIVTHSGAIARLDLAPLPEGGTMVCLTERNAAPLSLRKSPPAQRAVAPVLKRIADDALALSAGADVTLMIKDIPTGDIQVAQPVQLRAIAANLTLTALARSTAGATLTLDIMVADGVLGLSFTGLIGPVGSDEAPGVSETILNRFVRDVNGMIEMTPAIAGTNGRIRVRLPLTRAEVMARPEPRALND
ncbi:PAS domain-containing protein [Rubricella aquisinus]|uniref:PAS domain-containing protein n=1 Tax=Rubricella aquisinus TaxID=2028108 RepID=A0A840WIJ7_9RHOB|nr:PAS-domain containing protein [Rubricella aquisinus]MBB5514043.1 PAS domain-containing protein [Rubricella aquisinus]